MKKFTLALAGNPNCGKTTLFNALTGARQRVGNWPGVTVERIEGNYRYRDHDYLIIDLPGIYSFSAYSFDEKVSREYILLEKPDLVVNIIDATNLERTLYLTTQLLEMKIPVVVALNMMDLVEQKKIRIEIEHLATHLDCPVIPIIAVKKAGLDKLLETIYEYVEKHHISSTRVFYDSVVESALSRIIPEAEIYAEEKGVDSRWLAIKLLEADSLAEQMTGNSLQDILQAEMDKIRKHTNNEVDIVVADGRYGFIHGLTRDVLHREVDLRKNISDFIDKLVLNRVLSIPIFFAVMYLVFTLTIKIGAPFIDFLDQFTGIIFVDGFTRLLESFSSPEWLIILLARGVGSGIQTVSTFIPPVFFMFLSLAILEDSGYMSRAAFVMDRFMRFIGLPGKAFIPMMIGFGCNVPAILATRTLGNRKDKILTILINPLMSCGARLPVYTLFAAVFFPRNGAAIIFLLYATGILLAVLSGLLFKKILFRGETSTFVMELPPYHLPTCNGIIMHTWQRLKGFLIRAGKIIILFIIILNLLSSIGRDGTFGADSFENSILSHLGRKITPVLQPMGISRENWPASVGLLTGVFAKETVLSTLKSLYTRGEDSQQDEFDLWHSISSSFIDLVQAFRGGERTSQIENQEFRQKMLKFFGSGNNAFAYLLFVLIYMPCVGVISVIYREAGWRWTLFSMLYLTLLAWLVATLFFQISTLHLHPASSLFWITVSMGMMLAIYVLLKLMSNKNRGRY